MEAEETGGKGGGADAAVDAAGDVADEDGVAAGLGGLDRCVWEGGRGVPLALDGRRGGCGLLESGSGGGCGCCGDGVGAVWGGCW